MFHNYFDAQYWYLIQFNVIFMEKITTTSHSVILYLIDDVQHNKSNSGLLIYHWVI